MKLINSHRAYNNIQVLQLFFKGFTPSPSLELLIPVQIDQSDRQESSHKTYRNIQVTIFQGLHPQSQSRAADSSPDRPVWLARN